MANEPGLPRRKSKEDLILFQKYSENSQLFIRQQGMSEAEIRRLAILLQELGNKLDETMGDELYEIMGIGKAKWWIGRAVFGLGIGLGMATVDALLYGGFDKKEKLLFGLPVLLTSSVFTFAGAATHRGILNMWRKDRTKGRIMETLKNLCERFKNIIEPQRNALKQIKNALDEMNEKSTASMTTAGPQADAALTEIDTFLQLLQQMDESPICVGAKLIFTQLVHQCEKIYEEFTKMRNTFVEVEQ